MVPAATTAGVAVLVWATVTGPARIFGPPHLSPVHHPFIPPPTATAPPPNGGVPPPPPFPRAVGGSHYLSWLDDLLAWAVLLLLALGVVAVLVWAWRHRWRRPPAPLAVQFDVLPIADVAASLEQTSAKRLAALGRGSPRNGIVACWLLVEEAISAAGLPRKPWETTTEFTVRVLHSLDIDPRTIGSLAGLYREARFSGHPMTEDDRLAARAAAERLDEDIRTLRPPQQATP